MIKSIEDGLAHQEGRLRRRKTRDASHHRRLLGVIVANALSVAWHRHSPWVAYQRANDAYTNKAIWPEWLSARMLGQAVDSLAASDFVECCTGKWGERSSTYKATDFMQSLARQFGVDRWGLSLPLSRQMLVRLKDADKRLLSCIGRDDVECWADFLDGYNRFLAGHDIELVPEDDRGFSVRFKHKMWWEGVKEPELFRSHLYRVFNDGTFDHGGRLYGGWWQHIPKLDRSSIFIDGEPTVELDFSGFAIRSIYHQQGIDYREDPYSLEPIEAYALELGKPRAHFREAIKDLTQALLNGSADRHPERAKLALSFLPKFSRAAVQGMIEEKHARIGGAFRTQEGKRNQRLDSDIAMSVLAQMQRADAPCLPIHDSFVVRFRDKDKLTEAMMEAYYHRLKYNPVIN